MNNYIKHTDNAIRQAELRKLRGQLKFTQSQNSRFAILSVINFVYFTANFEDLTFIRKIWDVDGLAQHYEDKMKLICRRYEHQGFIPCAAIIDFFFQLSRHNQEKFIDWIQSNYHFSDDHKTLKP